MSLKGLRWIVGNGLKVSFWFDNCLPCGGPLADLVSEPIPSSMLNWKVHQFVTAGMWNMNLLRPYLPHNILLEIQNHPVPGLEMGEDHPSWCFTADGGLSTKSAYMLLTGLKTNVRRARCNLGVDSTCPLCESHAETELHLLRDCHQVCNVWEGLSMQDHVLWGRGSNVDVKQWVARFIAPKDNMSHIKFGATLWAIWNARNDKAS
ncbi:telomere repeat-binding factor 1-like protein [Sesbania bispinosa]|nr:telomere repeat-binding factor 1-like protein [Sesbania bispinosa]